MKNKCKSIRLFQLFKTKRLTLQLHPHMLPPLQITVTKAKDTPYCDDAPPVRSNSISRNATSFGESAPSMTKTTTSTSFCLGKIKIKKNSMYSTKIRSRMSNIDSKVDSDPYICINAENTFKKYKVIQRQLEINDMGNSDRAIEDINRQLYQSRYIVYINNHNILNDIKSFLSEQMTNLSEKQMCTLVCLIDSYTDLIKKEEDHT